MKIACEKCGYEITIEDKLLLEESMDFSCPACSNPISVGEKKPSLKYEDSSEMETQLLSKKQREGEEQDLKTMIKDKDEDDEESTHEGPQYEISDAKMTSDTKEKPEEPVAFSLRTDTSKNRHALLQPRPAKEISQKSSAKREAPLQYEKTEVSRKKAMPCEEASPISKVKGFFSSKKNLFHYMVLLAIVIASILYPLFALKRPDLGPTISAKPDTDPLIVHRFERYFDFDSPTGRELSIKLLEGAMQSRPGDMLLRSALAIAYADSGNASNDKGLLGKALEMSADMIAWDRDRQYPYIAMSLYHINDPEMSAKYLNRAMTTDARTDELGLGNLRYYIEANIEMNTGDIDSAEESLKKAYSLYPRSLRVLRMLSQIYSIKNNAASSKEIDAKIASLEEEYYREAPELRSLKYYLQAPVSQSPQETKTPAATDEPVRNEKPRLKAWESSFEEAKRLFFESNYLGAEKYFLSSIKDYKRLYPKLTRSDALSNIYSMLGQTYERLYKTDDALNAYRKAIANNQRNPNAHKGLAIIYETKIGDKPKAIKEYKEYLASYPEAPDKDEILQTINSLQK